ncbi:MAG: metalloregulator ArsR/SmtB family transcription factor [Gammaproteobacteria bacterium]|nr:metalloregulator ArsR/SmtB family transcription factor [Gammaproteobacteria bacterium]
MKLSIAQSTELWRLLADASRLRLLLLLEAHQLSVAELTEITGLAQSRVSTHLAKLKRAGLVQASRNGSGAQYSLSPDRGRAAELWTVMRERLDDPQARIDRERASEVVRVRKHGQTWAESVAGRMELHYSPGRTWEATARAVIGLLDLGDVLDIASGDGVMAELIAERAASVACVDISSKVLAAARKRIGSLPNVAFAQANMDSLPFGDARFDHVFLMHALSYARQPEVVLAEARRCLRSGGRLIVATLGAHRHEAAMQAYDHVNLGTTAETLGKWLTRAGFVVDSCRITSRDPRPPYFEVVTALARVA